ncbi:hypothetical protein B0H13DRAFT_1867838 [Mycena leptocephala]|nr:hypothetical protein B0H13DRAFT_1867838 [Mycena leptocephala]
MSFPDPHPALAPTRSSSEKHRSEKDDGIEVDLSRVTSNPGGAPTETVSALGRHVSWLSVVFLNMQTVLNSVNRSMWDSVQSKVVHDVKTKSSDTGSGSQRQPQRFCSDNQHVAAAVVLQ